MLQAYRREDAATLHRREAAPRLQWPFLAVYGSGARALGIEDDLVKETAPDWEMNFNKTALFGKVGLERNSGVHLAAFETARSRQ